MGSTVEAPSGDTRTVILKTQLPAFYSKIIPEEILLWDPQETKATCEFCAMAPDKKKRGLTYRADLKCCTFHPFLPNFLVGAILSEENESEAPARAVIRSKIQRREYSLPIGLTAPLRYQFAFHQRSKSDFGNREDWLCPYYQKTTDRCGVWRHRGSVCTSFFCKSDYGKKGLGFWKHFGDYLSFIEMCVLEECLAYLDFSPRQVSDLLQYLNRREGTTQEARSWVIPQAQARRLWNGYFDEQEVFFQKCWKLVNEWPPGQFAEALGEYGELLTLEILRRRQALVKEVP